MSVAVSSFFPNAPPSAPRNVAIRAAPAAALPATSSIRAVGHSVDEAERTRTIKPLHFPSVRTALWDRTPLGAALTLQPSTPHLAIPPRLLSMLAEHAAAGGGGAGAVMQAYAAGSPSTDSGINQGRSVPTCEIRAHAFVTCGTAAAYAAACAPPPHEALRLLRAAPPGTQPCAIPVGAVPWAAERPEARPEGVAYAALLGRSEAALDGTRTLAVGDAMPVHCACATSPDCAALLVRLEALVPTLTLEATPLRALHVLSSPLTAALRQPSFSGQLRTGFLTMDQTRRLICLGEGDPKAFEAPLVGVWVAGVRSLAEPYAWAACVRYARLRSPTAEALTASDGSCAFLCLSYEEAPPDNTAAAEPSPPPPRTSAIFPRLYDVAPRRQPSPYRLVGRAVQVALPVPASAAAETGVSVDLYACERPELSLLVRALPEYPGEGAPPVDDAPLPTPKAPLALTETTRASAAAAAAAMAAATTAASAAVTAADIADRASMPSLFTSRPRLFTSPRATVVEAPPTPPSNPAPPDGPSVALVHSMQAQLAAMGTRLEEQQRTIEEQKRCIERLTRELHETRGKAAVTTAPVKPSRSAKAAPPDAPTEKLPSRRVPPKHRHSLDVTLDESSGEVDTVPQAPALEGILLRVPLLGEDALGASPPPSPPSPSSPSAPALDEAPVMPKIEYESDEEKDSDEYDEDGHEFDGHTAEVRAALSALSALSETVSELAERRAAIAANTNVDVSRIEYDEEEFEVDDESDGEFD
jgi:hypothetical protein